MTINPERMYAVLDSRSGRPWIWTDSLTSEKRRSVECLLAFFRSSPRFATLTREQTLRILRREGVRVVRVRVEAIP